MPVVSSPIGVPSSLRAEHEELHGALVSALQLPGRLGEAARVVAESVPRIF